MSAITGPSTLQQEGDALRRYLAALEERVAVQEGIIDELYEQREHLNGLTQRVGALVDTSGALRAERNAAVLQTEQARNENAALRTRITALERTLRITGLRVERAQLERQLAEFDRAETQTQTLFGGAGVMVGAGWGMLGGPAGMFIGALVGGVATLLGAEDALQPVRQRRTQIETRIRQITQELMTLGAH